MPIFILDISVLNMVLENIKSCKKAEWPVLSDIYA